MAVINFMDKKTKKALDKEHELLVQDYARAIARGNKTDEEIAWATLEWFCRDNPGYSIF